MTNPKRASMREGPLAALFRKTEADEADESTDVAKDEASASRSQTPAARDERGAPHPALDATSKESRAEGVSAKGAAARGSSAKGAAGKGASTEGSSTESVSRGGRSDEGSSHTGVPTPKDRLKQAFSAEIPASLMDREAATEDAVAARNARPVMDDYSREHAAGAGTEDSGGQPRIRVVGVGGAGVNAVNRMVEAEVEGVEFLAVNTDQQSLQQSTADITLHIGAEITRGLGSGSDANVGRQAAMEDYDRVKALLKGSDMIFI